MKYEYFALDIDGTVFSSEEIIYPVYKESIELWSKASGHALDTPGRERIMLEIGKPVKTIFQNLFPQLSENDRDTLSDSVLKLLCDKISAGAGEYYPDVKKTITVYSFAMRRCTSRTVSLFLATPTRVPPCTSVGFWPSVATPTNVPPCTSCNSRSSSEK